MSDKKPNVDPNHLLGAKVTSLCRMMRETETDYATADLTYKGQSLLLIVCNEATSKRAREDIVAGREPFKRIGFTDGEKAG